MSKSTNLREPHAQLVMAHGWLLRGRIWQPLQQQLEPQWSCWAPDLPGFGSAQRPQGLSPTLPAYGRWLAQEAKERAAGAPVVLLGHSLGGSVVLHAASLLGAMEVEKVTLFADANVVSFYKAQGWDLEPRGERCVFWYAR